MSLILLCLLAVLAINFLIFPIAYKLQTDKLTDITYAISFATLAVFGYVVGHGGNSFFKTLLAGLILLWALRLGGFLLIRVTRMGKDARFDKIRTNPKRFFRFFLLQAVSSWLISLPFLYRLINLQQDVEIMSQVRPIEWAGILIALLGLFIETVADHQKSVFKKAPKNKEKVIMSGLYRYIRYPNYLGEILFWIGIFIASICAIQGIRWLALASPLIIILLLLFVSGIPTIEHARDKKHRKNPDYLNYLKKTKKLIPKIY